MVNRDLISTRGILQGWQGRWGLYVQPYWLYGRVELTGNKLTTDNEIYVRSGLFRTIAPPIFAYGVSVYEHSLRRQIEHRNSAVGGIGVNIVQNKQVSLLSSVGALYEITDHGASSNPNPPLVDGSIGEGLRKTARWSVRFYGRYTLAGGKVSLIHDLYVVPSFRDPGDDYRLLAFGAIDAAIAQGFSLRAQADGTREGLIVAGTRKDDLAVTFGVSYRNEWKRKKPGRPPPPPP